MRRPYVTTCVPVCVLAFAGHRLGRALDRRRCHQVHLAFAGNISRNLQHIHPPARQHRHREELRRRVAHQASPQSTRPPPGLRAAVPEHPPARPPSLPSACGNCRACVRDTRWSAPPGRIPAGSPSPSRTATRSFAKLCAYSVENHCFTIARYILPIRGSSKFAPVLLSSSHVFYLHGGCPGLASTRR